MFIRSGNERKLSQTGFDKFHKLPGSQTFTDFYSQTPLQRCMARNIFHMICSKHFIFFLSKFTSSIKYEHYCHHCGRPLMVQTYRHHHKKAEQTLGFLKRNIRVHNKDLKKKNSHFFEMHLL